MTISILFVLIGLVFLILAGELLVRSSSKIANAYGVPPLIIGLTVVAFGTSLPEFGVSLIASINGNPEIALTNVIGSNIFNLGFILGVCALISPLKVNRQLIKFDVPILIGASLSTYLFCLNGTLEKYEGLILFFGIFAYIFWLVRASKTESYEVQKEFSDAAPVHESKSLIKNYLFTLVSLAVLVAGAKLLVTGAIDLSKMFNVSDSLIGLTIVATGTSLPEVATSIMATIKGKTDIAVGNVIGSNIFNLLLTLGLCSSVGPKLQVNPYLMQFDLLVMLGISVACYPMLASARKLVRWEGALLLGGYICYITFLIIRG